MTIATILVLLSLFDVVDVASKALAGVLQLVPDARWLAPLLVVAFATSLTTDHVTDNTDPDADPIQDGFTNVNDHGHVYDQIRLTNSAAGSTAVGDVLAVSSQTAILGDTVSSLQKYVVATAIIANATASDAWARSGRVSAKANGAIAAGQYVRKSATARTIEDAGVAVGATTSPPTGAVGIALAAAAGGFCTIFLFERTVTGSVIQRGTFNPAVINSVVTDIYVNAPDTITYPNAYVAAPHVWFTGSTDSSDWWGSPRDITTTTFKMTGWSYNNGLNPADGRWASMEA